MSKEAEKAQLGAITLKSFCESWGTDIHARILLEVLFEGLFHEEALLVFGQPQQEGDKVDNSVAGSIESVIALDGSQQLEAPSDMGTTNSADHSE